ncbi:UNVERIFIED_CONTAM: hypothetical protein HDU68_008932 [Siphonaria sp. JEL0065]|nr:hypothetical protein HDU68_008932 [Siphonaria sp. JEL0065]
MAIKMGSFTKKPLSRRDLVLLPFDDIEEYRCRIIQPNQQNGGKNALVPLTNPLVRPPTPPTRTGEQICAQLKTQGVPEVPNELIQ